MNKRLARVAPIVALVCSLAPVAQAGSTCALDGAQPVPAFDLLETALIAQGVEAFSSKLDFLSNTSARSADEVAKVAGLAAVVKRNAPDGFDRCQVIVQRKDVGGMIQRITAFYARGSNDFALYLYQRAIPRRGAEVFNSADLSMSLSGAGGQLL